MLVVACGGGNGGGTDVSADGSVPLSVTAQQTPTKMEAARFLGQATFGPNEAEIDRLAGMSYGAWIDDQLAKPQTLHRLYINQASADLASVGQTITRTNFWDSWWQQALSGDDQLRQRVTFALSQILVVSFADATLSNQPRGVASYYDMLAEHAFGNYRDLLEAVTLQPMMGIYLSHLRNLKEDPATGRVPDLNFAREITQLFAVGQYELNLDGTYVMGPDGRPKTAYKPADLEGLSQVFTGLSWYAGPEKSDRTAARYNGQNANMERDWRPMQAYNEYAPNTSFHSVSEKRFWSTVIPAQTKSDTEGDLKIALDAIVNNPAVGPCVSKQLIQRLVTSNPSRAYVARVTAAFDDDGKGVRGDMKAVLRAVLLDHEARGDAGLADLAFGKLREPVLRFVHWARLFKARSSSGTWNAGNTSDPATSLGQSPMRSPSVFNFFRPGYSPPNTAIAAKGLVAPEFQLVNESSVAGYLNFMQSAIGGQHPDLKPDYATELPLADRPAQLLDRLNLLLCAGQLGAAARRLIVDAVAAMPGASSADRLRRVLAAVMLVMASADYLVQR